MRELEIATKVLPVSGLDYAISHHLEHRLPEGLAYGAKEGASPSLGISEERFVEETCLEHILECRVEEARVAEVSQPTRRKFAQGIPWLCGNSCPR